ncbi:hypothetical protein AGABI1DRAFT_103710 [Agaricus bisporus var. burnettii JB137-S8]|uniref:Mid2 domain-containing protein n=1 Tax=Agaricus bisporus var. burnettii (strain JB137-S8 / ATCC MYA-4627 / FGSC 10392) TaxID=597362 RepID=K5XJ71_AGABU|nr:uncharacterized protein AGABI1DRAFT_103710 [Agaricus bisporus var. burnettii JB137-S8]EKM83538.1 hypothetical protein AGABI1DRAFT_103710 [Agaricus bisporus var. burnettii JB137-S8]
MSVFLCLLVLFAPLVSAFSFSPGTPTECDAFSISWSGGTPPFTIHLVPVFNVPRNISVPAAAFKDGKGSFRIPQLPIAAGTQFMVTMSDSTGFGTGGTTDLLNPGPSKGGKCSTAPPKIGFQFQLNDVLSQCKPYGFSAFNQAAQPVTIMGLIPSGTPFVLNPPTGANQFSWTANLKTGTSVVFMMTDALGRSGGSSKLEVVVNSDDNTCLTGSFPSSTPAAPSSTPKHTETSGRPSSTSSGAPSTTTSSEGSPSGSTSGGAIAGTVIGALLFAAVIVSLVLFFLKRRRTAQKAQMTTSPTGFPPYGHNTNGYSLSSTANAAYNASAASPYTNAQFSPAPPPGQPQYPYGGHSYQQSAYSPSAYTTESQNHNLSRTHSGAARGGAYGGDHESSLLPYDPNPFSDQPPQHYPPAQYASQSTYELPSANAYALPNPYENPFNPPVDSREYPLPPPPPPADDPFASAESSSATGSAMSAQQRKAAMAGATSQPPRIMQHTDAEDILPPANDDGVVELPPQYTERRGLAVVNHTPTSSPSPDLTPMSYQHTRPPPS